MSCSEGPILAAWLDGELHPREWGRIESHLQTCEECQATWRLFHQVEVALQQSLPPEEADFVLEARTEILPPDPGAPMSSLARIALALAALAALLVFLTTPRKPDFPEVAPPPAVSSSPAP